MDLIGTQWNLQQQFISQYSQVPTNLQLSFGEHGALSVTAAGQTYQGSWTQNILDELFELFGLVSVNLTFAIGSTTFQYQGFGKSVQQQYGMGGAVSVNDSAVGTWDALSTLAS